MDVEEFESKTTLDIKALIQFYIFVIINKNILGIISGNRQNIYHMLIPKISI